MARIDKKKQKRQAQEEKRRLRKWVRENGAGTSPHQTRCEGCGRRLPGGEMESPMTCPICDSETALYDPQLL